MLFAHKQKHKRRSQFQKLLHQSFIACFLLSFVNYRRWNDGSVVYKQADLLFWVEKVLELAKNELFIWMTFLTCQGYDLFLYNSILDYSFILDCFTLLKLSKAYYLFWRIITNTQIKLCCDTIHLIKWPVCNLQALSSLINMSKFERKCIQVCWWKTTEQEAVKEKKVKQ